MRGAPINQKRLLEEELPQLQLHVDFGKTLDLPAVMPGYDNYALEIGFGGGEHLAWRARQSEDVGFVGCEPFITGVAGLLGHMVAEAGMLLAVLTSAVILLYFERRPFSDLGLTLKGHARGLWYGLLAAILLGGALAHTKGPLAGKIILMLPWVAIATVINFHAVMRYYQGLWVS